MANKECYYASNLSSTTTAVCAAVRIEAPVYGAQLLLLGTGRAFRQISLHIRQEVASLHVRPQNFGYDQTLKITII